MSTITTPNMNLSVPAVLNENGPQYASDINACMTTLDAHDHSTGNGVPITPSGLNISSDLTISGNNLKNIRTTRFQAQVSSVTLGTDVGCLYVSGADLYYNDTSLNQVRITQSGGVAGTPGSISNLVAPASASYSSLASSFIFQSAVNTPANINVAAVALNNLVASSKTLTFQPPNNIPSNYTITLPFVPLSAGFLGIDPSGNITSVASTSAGITSGNIASQTILGSNLANATITTTQIAQQTVSSANIAAVTIGLSNMATAIPSSDAATTGTYSNSGNTPTNIVASSTSLLSSVARPLFVNFSGSSVRILDNGISSTFVVTLFDLTNVTTIATQSILSPGDSLVHIFPASSFNFSYLASGNVFPQIALALRGAVTSGSGTISTNSNFTMQLFQV